MRKTQMNQQISLYEKKGLEEYKNKKYLWKALFACNDLYEVIANNLDEFPNINQKQLGDMVNLVLEFKYSVLDLIGRSAK